MYNSIFDKKHDYIKPEIFINRFDQNICLLAGSPYVKPGGGGKGNIDVDPPADDDEDTDISGAKGFYGFDYSSTGWYDLP